MWRRATTLATGNKRPADVRAASDPGRAAPAPGDPGAFPLLFDRYWEPVLRYCTYRLGTREDAEDTAQQVMIEVARALPRYVDAGDGALRSWVFAIAHAKAVDTRRGLARRPDEPLPADPPWTGGPSPEDAAAHTWLLAALDRLEPGERAVMELRAVELTTGEIARVLGLSEAAVRQRTKRARDRLRPLLAGENGGGGV